jgi:hypothetical protein
MATRTPVAQILLAAAALTAATAGSGAAQLPGSSAAALGMGDNHTALARGFAAVALNPAGLAMPDGPSASGSIAAIRAIGGLGPVELADLAEFEGGSVPAEVRQRWLDRIASAGREEGAAGGELTWVALQAGRFGLQLASTADVVASVGPGAAELILFGNAGRTGEPVDVSLAGSAFDLAVTSSVGFAYGHPVMRADGRSLSVGATLTYTVGHLMATAFDARGAATAEPLEVRFELPVLHTDSTLGLGGGERGSGIGLDLGLAWEAGPLRAGVTVRNLFNTFAWNEEEIYFRAGAVTVDDETRATDFEPQPLSAAPDGVRSRLDDLRFAPVVGAGIAYQPRADLRVSADLRHRIGESMGSAPATHVGAGAEYRPVGWLPLRAGGAVIPEGFLLSAGVGLDFGPVRLDGAAARREDDAGSASLGMLTVSFLSR